MTLFIQKLAGSLLAGTAALLCTLSQAQVIAPNVAVPFYTPGSFMQGVYRGWYAPQAVEFSKQSLQLAIAMEALCDAPAVDSAGAAASLQQAKTRWQATAAAWGRLSSVQIGPLLQRRSARQIDFTPTRPELIVRAIEAAPADARAMESIGTPAKGLPALEWLLYTRPAAPALAGTPDCRYAVQVAHEINREGVALSQAFNTLAAKDLGEEEEASVPAMGELVNQWVGAIEHLRWADMGKPLLAGASATASSADSGRKAGNAFPRVASGQTTASWQAQWQALRAITASQASEAPQPGASLAPLETYLRGRGLNLLANTLAQTVAKTDKAMQDPTPANKASVTAATRELASLKKLAETHVAPALQVNIGFSDADGD